LLDYEEDPILNEKMEMETLEKNIELHAEAEGGGGLGGPGTP
jgi:hypothetical protein